MESNSLQVEHLNQEANSLRTIFNIVLNRLANYDTKLAFYTFDPIAIILAKTWPGVNRYELYKKMLLWIRIRWMEIDSEIHELDPYHPSLFSQN